MKPSPISTQISLLRIVARKQTRKTILALTTCALTAALAICAKAQIQVAGNLQVSLDAVGLPVGPVTSIPNPLGAAGGVFVSYTNNGGILGLGPRVIAIGGNGTHGILFDGSSALLHQDGAGNALYAPTGFTGATNTTFTGFSVEAWVYAATVPDDNPVVSWGTRGNCDPNQVSCAYGASGSYGGLAMWCNDHGWGVGGSPAASQWHHLVWTLDNAGNENLYADGALKASYTQVVPAVDPNNNILIGASHANTGGSMSGALYGGLIVGRVRIEDGILSLSQVKNNYTVEVAGFTNGTPAFLSAKPLHRWSFTNAAAADATSATITDIGTAAALVNGIVRNNGGIATFTGSQLTLSGGSSANAPYVDFTNALVSVLSTNNGGTDKATFEVWVNQANAGGWTPIFDIGNTTLGQITGPSSVFFSGVSYVGLIATPGGNANQSALGFQGPGNYYFTSQVPGHQMHIALTWDDDSGLMTIYENGIEVGAVYSPIRMAAVQDLNNWLGRSLWQPDSNLNGSVAEFRIFNRIVTPAEILNDYQVGPTVVSSVLRWNGNLSGDWDINTTANWLVGATPVKYNDGGTVQFDDSLTGTPDVNVTTVVQPAVLTVNNTSSNYVFSGSGSISGPVGLTKNGNGNLTLNNQNNYTGVTALNGGTVIVTNLANGGSPSPIGAASAAPANISFAGGTLSYRGPATSINRGYSVSGNSTLDVQGNLALSGTISASGGTFSKSGPATLTYNDAGINQLSAGGGGGAFTVGNGTVVIDGTAGQTNRVNGETWVGFDQVHGASLVLSNTVMTNTSWFAVGRGNGTGGLTSSATLYNTLYNVGNFSLGYANGIAGNQQTVNLILSGNSRLINTGGTGAQIGESSGSIANLVISNNSFINSNNRLLFGSSLSATGTVLIANNGAITNGGWVSLGAPGSATVTLKDNAVWQALVDFNVTDAAANANQPSISTLNIQDSALLRINTLYVAKNNYCTGTINQSGGTVVRNGGGDWRIGGNVNGGTEQLGIWNLSGGLITCAANFQVGAYGTGYFNQSGGTVNLTGGFPDIGRFAGGTGFLNVSGGTFNQLNSGTLLLVGEAGTGTLNVSGTGVVNVQNTLGLGWAAGGFGTLNLTNGSVNATNGVVLGNNATGSAVVNLFGGTLATTRVSANAGSSSFNFFGGTLKALPGANGNFLSGVSQATVFNGAVIDSDVNTITIAQDLYDGGVGGGLTKLGPGSLTLSGNLYYNGPTHLAAGTLNLTTHDSSPGSVAVDDGTSLTLQVLDAAGSGITPLALTVGNSTGASLTINLGNFGNPPSAPIRVAGAVQVNGIATLNIDPASTLSIGEVPLISYGTLGGGFVLGTLPAGVSGYLTNDTAQTPNFVGLVVTEVVLPRWEGLAGGTWDVQVTTNWVDQVTLLPDYFYQGNRAVFDDRAQGTTSVDLVTNVIPGGVLVSNNALTYTISGTGRISGSGGLTKLGTNTFTLSTTNNNYTGPTRIDEGGTLFSTVANNLGTNSALTLSNASVLNVSSNSQKFSSVTLANGTIAASGATVTAGSYNLDNGSIAALLAGGSLSTFGASTDAVSVLGGNTYTGRTVLAGSTLVITNLANGGSASSIGSSSSNPTNLVFAGGTLSYTGPAVSINRGYSVAGSSSLDVEGNLAISGPVTATAGTFTKEGPAQLTYNGAGVNNLSVGGGGGAYGVGNGTVVLDGSAGQTNTVNGEIWVGFDQANSAALLLTNTVVTNTSWLAIGRGNGTNNLTSAATLNNSLLACGNVSLGYANGIAENAQNVFLTLSGNSKLINTGGTGFNLGESAGSSCTLTILSNSWVTSQNRVLMAMSTGSTGTVVIANSGALTNSGWVSIGDPGVATATLRDNAVWQALTDFNVTDVTGDPVNPSIGTLNIQDNATLIINTLYVGKSGNCSGTINQIGGTVIRNGGGDWRIGGNVSGAGSQLGTYNLSGGFVYAGAANLQIGAYGVGQWTQTGGFASSGSFCSIGRYPGATGEIDISGGSFNNTNPATLIIIGEEGTGTLNISSSGLVMAAGGLSVGHTATGIGTVSLNGGVLSVSRVFQNIGTATAYFNFNGGLLQALPGSYPSFMNGFNTVAVQVAGANIDSGANSITINSILADGGGGGLTKLGSGILTLAATNTYTGTTVVSNGTLRVNGSIVGNVDVKAGGTVGGTGTINGTVTVEPNGTLNAGTGIGTLTVANPPVLNGIVLAELNWNGGSPIASKLVLSSGTLAYSGTLVLANVGVPLAPGDTFTIFSAPAYVGSFTVVSQTPGQAVTWDTSRLALDGTVKVATAVSIVPINVGVVVSGGSLHFSWPADHLGWRLLVQTNHLGQGISTIVTDWDTLAGSTTNTSETIPIDPSKPAEFYRLVYP